LSVTTSALRVSLNNGNITKKYHPEESILQVAVKRTHRRVILPRLRRALLKIKWEQRETPGLLFRLISSAGPTRIFGSTASDTPFRNVGKSGIG